MQYLMYVAYAVYVIAAVLMIGAILLQEGKGGGLSALGGTQAESAFGASNPIRRMTVVLAVLFFLLAGFLSYMSSSPSVSPGTDQPAAKESSESEKESESDKKPKSDGESDDAATPEGEAAAPAGGEEAEAPATPAEE